ncbi:glycosyltransferase family 4 protein [Zavarzinella formosa]|uniref:glycosyltransferase family 4 protein n=1 Tax=Zavarzinella formosa TaxID=360055 RepID=UPI000313313E|nr:glycosyltransferase family 1 protein [Zavarzinella formosa]
MRVVINVTSTAGNKTGIGHHITEMMKALRATGEVELSTYPHPVLSKVYSSLGGGPKIVPLAPPTPINGGLPAGPLPPRQTQVARATWVRKLRAPLRHAWQMVNSVYTRAEFDRRRYDLYHEPNFVPLAGRLPVVVNIYDLSMLLYPQWHPADRIAWFERFFMPNYGKIAHVLAISDYARQEIIKTLGFPPERVTRTYCGVRKHFRPLPADETANTLRSLGLPPTYLLHVGTIEPRKNLDMLLRAYCSLPDELRQKCPLVLVGSWGWRMEETARYFDEVARHKNVIRPGYLPDDALPAVYNGARALLFPTVYEGFGLPAAEMLACDGAVISSTAGAVAEVLGKCGHLIDPHDSDGWRNAMAKIITDDDWRNTLRQGGLAQAAQFTWEGCARDTLKAYRKTLEDAAAKRVPLRTV